jgi:hypothetical protein
VADLNVHATAKDGRGSCCESFQERRTNRLWHRQLGSGLDTDVSVGDQHAVRGAEVDELKIDGFVTEIE